MLEMLWKCVSKQFDRWTLRLCSKIWGLILKKIKVVETPHVDALLRKNLKHQTDVDNKMVMIGPVSFNVYDSLYWNK